MTEAQTYNGITFSRRLVSNGLGGQMAQWRSADDRLVVMQNNGLGLTFSAYLDDDLIGKRFRSAERAMMAVVTSQVLARS